MWSISRVNGHLKGDSSQSESWRGLRVAQNVQQNATKFTKMHKKVTVPWRSKVFWICPQWLMWVISGVNGHWKGDSSQSKSWRSHGVAREVHQNVAKCTKMVTMPWQSQGDNSQRKSWRDHGVAQNVQQNATKLTKMHQNSHCTMTEQRISNLYWVTYVIHFWS